MVETIRISHAVALYFTCLNIRLNNDRFPRSGRYHPDWLMAGVSGAANPLWLAEWLSDEMELRPGMRVLDLGCGRAMSSIFLRREFGVEVWATDLWFSASENLQRIRDAGVGDGVYPLHADARNLPFASEFFDAIVSLDSFPYYGTDATYLACLTRFLKPGAAIGIAGASLLKEIEGPVPDSLRAWWTPDLWCLHSAEWWRGHWERSGIVEVQNADSMPNGWKLWLEWMREIAPENTVEIEALEADRGEYLGYTRIVGRKRPDAKPEAPITSLTTEYTARPLLR